MEFLDLLDNFLKQTVQTRDLLLACGLFAIPLAKRRHRENPAFDLRRAYRRIRMVAVLAVVLTVLATILAAALLPLPAVVGYLLGMILGFVCSLRRMSPNNERNQRSFDRFYEDCLTEESDMDDTRIS